MLDLLESNKPVEFNSNYGLDFLFWTPKALHTGSMIHLLHIYTLVLVNYLSSHGSPGAG